MNRTSSVSLAFLVAVTSFAFTCFDEANARGHCGGGGGGGQRHGGRVAGAARFNGENAQGNYGALRRRQANSAGYNDDLVGWNFRKQNRNNLNGQNGNDTFPGRRRAMINWGDGKDPSVNRRGLTGTGIQNNGATNAYKGVTYVGNGYRHSPASGHNSLTAGTYGKGVPIEAVNSPRTSRVSAGDVNLDGNDSIVPSKSLTQH